VRATDDPSECAGAGLALVLVKSWQTERAAGQLAEWFAPEGVALTLQNGLGNREVLAGALGAERVALGVTTTGATLVGPGLVRPGGEGTTSLGEHPRLEPLVNLLRQAGFAVESVPSADDLLWSKLVINAAINPLTALLRCPNGELVARPAARSLMAAAAREAADVAEACGRSLIYSDPVAVCEDVARRTAANHSSMFQDVQRGAPTEIDAICGAIVAAGEAHSVPTPVNRVLWLLVKALVQRDN
jgi:2-dehydropantoate 2-reductase